MIDTDAEIRIGAQLIDGRYFKGKISCVQIYSKALSEAEVAAVKDRCFEGRQITLGIIVCCEAGTAWWTGKLVRRPYRSTVHIIKFRKRRHFTIF